MCCRKLKYLLGSAAELCSVLTVLNTWELCWAKAHAAVFIETTRSVLLPDSSYGFFVAGLSIGALLESYEVEQSISVPLLKYDTSHIRSSRSS
jgi:hypothetical protein